MTTANNTNTLNGSESSNANELGKEIPLEWAELWKAMKSVPQKWVLTTNEMYWAMLECLPPRAMQGDGFLVGEADHDNSEGVTVYACFMQRGDVTKARYLTVKEFHANSYPAF